MKHGCKAIALIALISAVLFIPLANSSTISATTSINESYDLKYWEQWNDGDSQAVYLVSESEIGLSGFQGFAPASTFHCWTPYITEDGSSLQKGYWLSDVKPVKCIWEYYDPLMHKFFVVEKKPSVVYEGDFNGHRYAFADTNDFIIPALFLSERYGNWAVRTYFKFEDGSYGAEGPVTDDEGNSYLLSFPVVKGSWADLVFNAPIYLLGHKTIPLFWWLSPIWIFLIFFVILVIYTRSVVGAVKAIKGAVKATQTAKTEWRRK